MIQEETQLTHAGPLLCVESDEELFGRIASEGGGDAFRLLYERHAAKVFAYCNRMLGSRDEAKDIFQESFIRLHHKAVSGPEGIRVAPYLYTIAHNLCISAIRARKRNVPVEENALLNEEHALESTERAAMVRLAIELLPVEYREPLLLHQYDDVAYADIAEILSIPLSTVKIRIYRAKEKLRAILAPYFQER